MKSLGSNCFLLTGATGFLGHYILAGLVDRGSRCVVLLRPPIEDSVARLVGLLSDLGIDAERCITDGSIEPVCGELPGDLSHLGTSSSVVLIHVAAATNFRRNRNGDPEHTNIDGTRALLDWAGGRGVQRVHLVSSAFTCGKTSGPVAEAFQPNPPAFHNDYERSKWESERLGVEWSQRTGGEITIHRPSIIVGAFQSGRATKFGGVYLSARATELVDRMHREHTPAQRQSITLRIVGRPLDRQNIVPVDYVASMIVAAANTPAAGGRVHHLVHPNAPTNLQIKQAYEQYFRIGGGRFVPPEDLVYEALEDLERGFYDVIKPIEHYFVDTPVFRRENAVALEQRAGVSCPTYDAAAFARLVRYAQSTSWGKRHRPRLAEEASCAEYFESFLPFHVAKSEVARMTAMTATVSFVIDDEPEGRWLCTFDRGRLVHVDRARNGRREDFGYRTTRSVFWESVSGRPHPQELFLTGRAEMFGNIERALKMSMILHSFAREFPCDPKVLAEFVRRS